MMKKLARSYIFFYYFAANLLKSIVSLMLGTCWEFLAPDSAANFCLASMIFTLSWLALKQEQVGNVYKLWYHCRGWQMKGSLGINIILISDNWHHVIVMGNVWCTLIREYNGFCSFKGCQMEVATGLPLHCLYITSHRQLKVAQKTKYQTLFPSPLYNHNFG